jgi:sec-independent protein translocase protein TatB
MFDIGWSELVVIGVVALIAIGPKELPGVLRTVGQYMGKVRRMASEFQSQFQEAMREAEMADIKKSVDEMTESATKHFTDFDPIGTVRKEIDALSADPFKDTTPKDPAPTPATASPEAAASVSPEAAAPGLPAPLSPDATIPQPATADIAIAPEAPQPVGAPSDAKPSGSGA